MPGCGFFVGSLGKTVAGASALHFTLNCVPEKKSQRYLEKNYEIKKSATDAHRINTEKFKRGNRWQSRFFTVLLGIYSSLSVWFCVHPWLNTFDFVRFEFCNERSFRDVWMMMEFKTNHRLCVCIISVRRGRCTADLCCLPAEVDR